MTPAPLPDWLTQEYMQSKLRLHYKDDKLLVHKLWSNAATAKGDNYVGIITRLNVEFQLANGAVQQSTYLSKETVPEDAPQAEVFADYGVYQREMDMYEFVLPKMTQLLREVGIKDKLHADAIAVDREHMIVILEDLATLKYSNADRVQQLDFEHVKITLAMLAKYHAASAVLKQRYPALLEHNFVKSFFTRGLKGYAMVFQTLFKALIRHVEAQPKLAARYLQKLQHMLPNIMEYGARCFDVTDTDFQTLTHGDCWTTNIMFQHDAAGKPTTVVPIDFQFSVVSSPVVDLLYFFATSLQEPLRARETELLQYYHIELQQALRQLAYKGKLPNLHEFYMQLERRRFMSSFR
ncbi:uncharacterized protein LOC108604592 isoform X2 [Drosophila busckii]|uniref:uncharacterized protein LOC108604592 isoform X2 n=1 Tax=Drosophila busckii TaxID=30019 RepID=UPI0014331FA5|nr:uncharacterized protein LOC108604592 isoform X2 [Drosophila busckii]